MLWKNGRRSDNIEDQRASGPRPGGRGGLVGDDRPQKQAQVCDTFNVAQL